MRWWKWFVVCLVSLAYSSCATDAGNVEADLSSLLQGVFLALNNDVYVIQQEGVVISNDAEGGVLISRLDSLAGPCFPLTRDPLLFRPSSTTAVLNGEEFPLWQTDLESTTSNDSAAAVISVAVREGPSVGSISFEVDQDSLILDLLGLSGLFVTSVSLNALMSTLGANGTLTRDFSNPNGVSICLGS